MDRRTVRTNHHNEAMLALYPIIYNLVSTLPEKKDHPDNVFLFSIVFLTGYPLRGNPGLCHEKPIVHRLILNSVKNSIPFSALTTSISNPAS
jgi:hypothetical protein